MYRSKATLAEVKGGEVMAGAGFMIVILAGAMMDSDDLMIPIVLMIVGMTMMLFGAKKGAR